MSHRLLGVLILLWAAITWGGRIGLLVGSDPVAVARIVISIAVALAAGYVLIRRHSEGRGRLVLWTYALVTAAIWLSSLANVWTNDNSIGFRLVHTALAAVSLALAAWAAVRARAVPGNG